MKLFLSAGLFLLASASLSFSQPTFCPPVNLGWPINTAYFEADPFLTADGKKLFFATDRPNGFGQEDIWFSEWTGSGWTYPTVLGPQINTLGREMSPSVSPDGLKLYYVSGSAGWDIWVSTWDSSVNDWGTPVNLGAPVNTPGGEFSAHLAPDGRRLYFTTEGDERCGIYMSEWNDTSWSVPQLQWGCGSPEYPSVSANGLWLYFDHYVPDGKSIFVTSWKDSSWGFPAIDLRPEIGGRAGTPFVTPSGDSLFFAGSADLGGVGSRDIWMTKRLKPGDLNLDSQLTPADVVLELNKVYFNESYLAPERLGDLNCDTNYSPADVVLLLNAAFLGNAILC